MGLKTVRTSIRLDKADIDFLDNLGILKNRSDSIRFCIKVTRLYSIPAIKHIYEDI